MNSKRRYLVATALASLLVFAAASPVAVAADGKGTTINIGYFPVVSPVPIMQAQRQLE